jgi:hypothetical protein
MTETTITTEQMTEILRDRALIICQLSLEITTRGIAQGWAEVHGHVNSFSAVIRPIDATIPEDGSPRPALAELRIELDHYDFHCPESKARFFRERLLKADQHIAYLKMLSARGKIITIAAMQGAA